MERVMNGVTQQFLGLDRGLLGLFRCLSEQEADLLAHWTERSHRRQRQVKFQAVREDENAVDDCAAREIKQMDGLKLAFKRSGPVLEHFSDLHIVGDREHQVEVGPSIPSVACE